VRVLVTGATGFVGRHLVAALTGAGHDVVAGTRRPDADDGPSASQGGAGDGPPRAARIDLLDPTTFERALEGCDAVYYLVHSMESPGRFAERDRQAAVSLRDTARERGLRIVYLGALGDTQEAAARSEHLRSRHEVGWILRDGTDAVELRAAIVVGAGSVSFEILRQLVDRLPVLVCPRWVTTRCQPIAIADVVRYLVGALDIPAGSYEVGGADVLTYEEMMRRYATMTGRHRLIIKVPVYSLGLSSHGIGLLTDQPPAVARPLADGLSVEVVVSDHRIRALVPFEPMGFDEATRAALGLAGRARELPARP